MPKAMEHSEMANNKKMTGCSTEYVFTPGIQGLLGFGHSSCSRVSPTLEKNNGFLSFKQWD
jgi:hypothetical protein